MNILLVEDEYLARAELSHLLKKDSRVESVHEADSIQDALKTLLTYSIDIAYLDIHLTDESGMDLADMIKTIPDPPVIIFATAYDQYALEAFEKNARDYILKPFEEKRVSESLQKAIDQLENSSSEKREELSLETVSVQTDDKIYVIKITSIIMIEAMQGKAVLYTDQRQYESKSTLQFWEEKLVTYPFMRVHRSYVINLEKISEIEPWFNHTYQVTMETGQKVPVSRSFIKAFREKVDL
ncbi:LytR/AlgR family response regulator transcription factor [Alkalibacterium olivapovliticus]|uniref:Two-component system response regulator LytT n=1 Tax=Alkalibacterium olivapovliticus TaxID=99907 RepID=A0A2T0W645_9LACT|nr:LytTR family transcriptional regulator DNA-binding domain-containing protein [Alkalibacterium olivapovliticus]PRY81024.1 two-component system response regulator LytT [Alkalibacterium olivapovliticus]